VLLLASKCFALTVESDFEGASVKVLSTDDATQTVRFMPGGDAKRGWACWWYFRVTGLDPMKPLKLEIQGSDAIRPQDNGKPASTPLEPSWAMPRRSTYSTDGRTWKHTAEGQKQDKVMHYELMPGAASVMVAWGPPYPPGKATEAVKDAASRAAWAVEKELCKSREGRSVPMLHISEGDRTAAQRFGIWVEARQHAWESGGSWVCQGFMDWIMSDEMEAQWLRQNAEIFIVPVMDIDNTATGNGGKEGLPHDHNRDWTADPHWNEVAAAQRLITELASEGRIDVFLDLHNPAPNDKEAHFFAPPDDALHGQQVKNSGAFNEVAVKEIGKITPIMAKPKISGPGYHPLWRQISCTWVAEHGCDQTVALCLETPWNTENSTTDGYKAVGGALGKAVQKYLGSRR
jgi:hypothetical protein